MSDNEFQIVLCSCPDIGIAKQLAHHLVAKRLAACVNIIPQILSIYRWQEKIEENPELLLVIKTSAARYAQLEHAIKTRHPYEAPEIIALPIQQGLPVYLDWLRMSVSSNEAH